MQVTDKRLVDALAKADSETEDHYAALVELAEAVRAHLSGPGACERVRGAEAERRDIIDAEVRNHIGNLHAELERFEAEFGRRNAVCDSRTADLATHESETRKLWAGQ